MPNAGQYNRRVTLLTPTYTTDDIGAEPECFTEGGSLWCAIEETNGRVEDIGQSNQSGADATIRVRNYPAVTTKDRLQDSNGYVWIIESITNGDNELICECHRYDFLTEFVICSSED